MALPEAGPKDGKKSEQDDRDFDPSAEALIDEIDDERTLEEEEALGGNNGATVQNELDDLKKESEMPIEELLAYYEKMRNQTQARSESEYEEDDDDEETGAVLGESEDELDEDYSYTDEEKSDDERDWRRSIHIGPEHQAEVPGGCTEYDNLPPYENDDKLVWSCDPRLTQEQIIDYLKKATSLPKRNDISVCPASVPKISSESIRLYREKMQDITSSAGLHVSEQNHENRTIDYPIPFVADVYMSQSRKRVRIDHELDQENALDGQQSGLHQAMASKEDNSDSTSQETRPEMPTDEYFQDEEQLLFLLLQCNYNFEEALRRRRLDPFKYFFYEPMSLWSQEECLGFEHGLRVHGKDFRSIREHKVPTRTYAEVVAFYYLWKKSERHDVYTNQYKLDRKRSLSHPGTTDYMDKFIEDNESNLNASSTPTPNDYLPCSNLAEVTHGTQTNKAPIELCHLSNNGQGPNHQVNPTQGQNVQKTYLQLNQRQKSQESEQSSVVCIENNEL